MDGWMDLQMHKSMSVQGASLQNYSAETTCHINLSRCRHHERTTSGRCFFCQCKLLLRPSPDLCQFTNVRSHHAARHGVSLVSILKEDLSPAEGRWSAKRQDKSC
ncbi:hypothetical protein AAFF_G00237280 [Aldrovandia affinis]|uniref:Uncharacterized protein n=1 Tax=Aldrovandia affinis TaxID=143900 RepID=A0AAD7W3B6_9TELE|nr:hypothetical protein AAFF_G00237280 [Aldrovandia affinis]